MFTVVKQKLLYRRRFSNNSNDLFVHNYLGRFLVMEVAFANLQVDPKYTIPDDTQNVHIKPPP